MARIWPAILAPVLASAPADGAPANVAHPEYSRTEKMSRLWRTIATRMVRSLQVSAQFTALAEADITRLAATYGAVVDRVVPLPNADGGRVFAVRSIVYLSVS